VGLEVAHYLGVAIRGENLRGERISFDIDANRTAKVVLMNLLITRDVEKGIGITKASVQL
jgi:hypothetical protein